MPAHNGRVYGLYVAETQPTNPNLSTDPAYKLLGLLTTNGFNTARNAIEVSSKSDGDDSVFIAGRRNSNVPFTARFDHMVDEGQDIVGRVINGSPGLLWFLMTANVSQAWQVYGQAIPTAKNVVEPDEAPGEINGTLQITGPVTEDKTP